MKNMCIFTILISDKIVLGTREILGKRFYMKK